MTNYLYDTDEVEQLIIQYGLTNSPKQKEQVKEQIIEETIDAVYSDTNPYTLGFFSGIPLLVVLIDLHRESDDPHLLEHIEREIELQRIPNRALTAEFDPIPFPTASCEELLTLSERVDDRIISHYFRLRAFQDAGAFSDPALPKVRGGEDAELTDKEVDYLQSM